MPISTKMKIFRLPLQPTLEKLQRWTFFLFSHPFQYLWYSPCLFAVLRPPLLRFYSYIMHYKIWIMGVSIATNLLNMKCASKCA